MFSNIIIQVADPDEAVESIDYIKNSLLEEAYNNQKAILMKEGKEMNEILLFHGTALANVDSILSRNFSLNQPFDRPDKDKRRVFGQGIYFSEMPAVSLMYGTA